MRRIAPYACLFALLTTACSSGDDEPAGGSGGQGGNGGAAGGGSGGASGGSGGVGGGSGGAGGPDMDASTDSGAMSDGGGEDGATDSGTMEPTDGSTGERVVATLNARCELSERIGRVVIAPSGLGQSQSVYAVIMSGPDPRYGAFDEGGEDCRLHRAPTGCPTCDIGETCGKSGVCENDVEWLGGLSLTVKRDALEQTITSAPTDVSLSGEIAIASPYTLELAVGSSVVVVENPQFPTGLLDLAGTMAGSYDAPGDINLTWDLDGFDGRTFVHVPNNHHLGGAVFTECDVPAAQKELVIESELLVPLSGSTGLEFQGVEHVMFAAAELPEGCVEFRFSIGHQVNLEAP